VLIVPIVVAVTTIVDHTDDIVSWAKSLAGAKVPSPPSWVEGVPVVGSRIASEWRDIAATDPQELAARSAPYVRNVVGWFAAQAGGFGLMLLHFLLTVIITAILYATGETAATGVRRFARRLASQRGDECVVLAGQAIRAVALGVVVTAIVQSLVAGLGLAITGVPYAGVLTAVIFMLCIAQLGPTLVLAPAVVWLYWRGDPVWGTVLLVWTVIVGTLDNFLRPYLIKKGADLPLLLIFAGVIGGLISFGIIGLFVGPVVLAVTYKLLAAWVADIDHAPLQASAPDAPTSSDPAGIKKP
jgi:predicted PurR-regulated permease PerM